MKTAPLAVLAAAIALANCSPRAQGKTNVTEATSARPETAALRMVRQAEADLRANLASAERSDPNADIDAMAYAGALSASDAVPDLSTVRVTHSEVGQVRMTKDARPEPGVILHVTLNSTSGREHKAAFTRMFSGATPVGEARLIGLDDGAAELNQWKTLWRWEPMAGAGTSAGGGGAH